MILLYCKNLLRCFKRAHLLFIVGISILYAISVYSEEPMSLGIGLFSALSHEQLIMSICLLPSFLCSYVVFDLLYKNEKIVTWMSFFVYPISCQKWFIIKAFTALLMQPVLIVPSILTIFSIEHSIHNTFFLLLVLFQFLHFTFYLFYCFQIARGYLIMQNMVSVVNVGKNCTTVFLLLCILNLGSWLPVLIQMRCVIIVACIISWGILYYNAQRILYRKLEREVVLKQILHGFTTTQIEVMKNQYKQMFDIGIQKGNQKWIQYGKGDWKKIACVEVCLKQHGYLLILIFVCLFYSIQDHSLLLLGISFLCVFRICLYYREVCKELNRVRIYK